MTKVHITLWGGPLDGQVCEIDARDALAPVLCFPVNRPFEFTTAIDLSAPPPKPFARVAHYRRTKLSDSSCRWAFDH